MTTTPVSEKSIPTEVIENAYTVLDGVGWMEPKGSDLAERIARALMAERGRCAGIAASFIRYHGEPGSVATNPYVDANEIVRAIWGQS
jgi:hypothetical protein